MPADYDYDEPTQLNPVDTGVENAKRNIEVDGFEIYAGEYEKVRESLAEIFAQNRRTGKIPEQFVPVLFELIALIQFQRIKDNSPLWDKAELERLTASLWEILERWLNPSRPK